MTRYFLIGASKDHLRKGVGGGFAQAGHGRKNYISKPAKGDWLVFYSAKEIFEDNKPFQKFTAIGQVADEAPYQAKVSAQFTPYRRKVIFNECHETSIRPLLEQLSFIKNTKNWGFYLMSGFREISKEDFKVIEKAME